MPICIISKYPQHQSLREITKVLCAFFWFLVVILAKVKQNSLLIHTFVLHFYADKNLRNGNTREIWRMSVIIINDAEWWVTFHSHNVWMHSYSTFVYSMCIHLILDCFVIRFLDRFRRFSLIYLLYLKQKNEVMWRASQSTMNFLYQSENHRRLVIKSTVVF